jgi:xanthine dehydrogenase accessory factor
LNSNVLDQILADRKTNRAAVLISRLRGGEQWLVHPGEGAPEGLSVEVVAAGLEALQRDASILRDFQGESYFLQSFNPRLRLILVGAVHIAQSLAKMASLAGFEVVVVDPREAFATPARFDGVELRTEWPSRAIEALHPDGRTAIVTLSHDPKIDEPALDTALASPAFYIGALGSKKTHRARLEGLAARGFAEADRARICGPVGLSIGSATPSEIAVSILAEVIATLRVAKE